jgi:hypothetical protein
VKKIINEDSLFIENRDQTLICRVV